MKEAALKTWRNWQWKAHVCFEAIFKYSKEQHEENQRERMERALMDARLHSYLLGWRECMQTWRECRRAQSANPQEHGQVH